MIRLMVPHFSAGRAKPGGQSVSLGAQEEIARDQDREHGAFNHHHQRLAPPDNGALAKDNRRRSGNVKHGPRLIDYRSHISLFARRSVGCRLGQYQTRNVIPARISVGKKPFGVKMVAMKNTLVAIAAMNGTGVASGNS